MKRIVNKIGLGVIWVLKGLLKIVLLMMHLVLWAVKLFLMLFSIVFRILLSFIRIGST